MTNEPLGNLPKEMEFLGNLSYTLSASPQAVTIERLIVRTFHPFLSGDAIALELGCADGFMTDLLSRHVRHLDVVDASDTFLARARERNIPNANFIRSLFEEYSTDTKYDYVFACYVLEHVLDVPQLLGMVRSVLKPNGLLFAVVPNARALSRQLALHMGLISDLKELTPNDLKHGHRRVYDRVNFNRDLESAGFSIICQGGIMLKFLADFQLDKLIGDRFLQDSHIEGLYTLGLEYPDLCGTLFSICQKAKV